MLFLPGASAASVIRRARVGLFMIGAITSIAACGGGPPARLYLLEPVSDSSFKRDDVVLDRLGIAMVTLPGYAKDARIASRREDGSIYLNDDHRWAEAPEEAITRVLAERLRERSGATLLAEPWPRDFEPVARVEVAFDRLLRESLGGVDMAGQILILSGDGRNVLRVQRFQFVHYGQTTDPAEFFVATSHGVDDIARMAVEALLELESKR